MNRFTQHLTTVTNLRTDLQQEFTLPPEEAVIAAFAQSRGDWNTWKYSRYTVQHGSRTVVCGDFCAITKDKE